MDPFPYIYKFSILSDASSMLDTVLLSISEFMNSLLFFPVFGIPFIVGFLAASGLLCTLVTGFVNIRMFRKAVSILFGKDTSSEHNSEQIPHIHAFITALSGTVGLGTIAGVAIAVSIGGPGAIGWMIIAGFFGMSLKFLEVSLAFKNRVVLKNGSAIGGPFSYIKNGLTRNGFRLSGLFFSKLYAVLLFCAGVFGSVAFQSNQMVSIISSSSKLIAEHSYITIGVITLILWFIITGGLKRVAKASSSLVPLMACVYLTGCFVIIIKHIDNFIPSVKLIVDSMFNNNAAYGGTIGAITAGLRRAVFANEAGMGTAAIAHSATDEKEPIKVGLVAMLEPCFDTIIICVISGITVVISGAYKLGNVGIMMSRDAFLSVSDWFVILLQFSAPLFAFTTIVTFGYYCEITWMSFFDTTKVLTPRLLVMASVILSGLATNISSIAMIGDMFFMLAATVNIVALLFMHREIICDLNSYITRFREVDNDKKIRSANV